MTCLLVSKWDRWVFKDWRQLIVYIAGLQDSCFDLFVESSVRCENSPRIYETNISFIKKTLGKEYRIACCSVERDQVLYIIILSQHFHLLTISRCKHLDNKFHDTFLFVKAIIHWLRILHCWLSCTTAVPFPSNSTHSGVFLFILIWAISIIHHQ